MEAGLWIESTEEVYFFAIEQPLEPSSPHVNKPSPSVSQIRHPYPHPFAVERLYLLISCLILLESSETGTRTCSIESLNLKVTVLSFIVS
jgi:hypothetical protein